MAFWTKPFEGAAATDPKRNFRFRVSFGANSSFNGNSPEGIWFAKKVSQPQVSIGETEHNYLMHRFYFPGRVTWNEVDMTLVDPVEPHVSYNFLNAIQQAGFKVPGTSNDFTSVSKNSAALQLGDVLIEAIDEQGVAIHKWKLWHAWAKEITFSELDYSNEDLMEITLKIRYDWAEFEVGPSQYVANAGNKVFSV
jgi:hypothetical protein